MPESTAETWALASSNRAALLMYDGVGTCFFLTWIARFLARYVPGPIASGVVHIVTATHTHRLLQSRSRAC